MICVPIIGEVTSIPKLILFFMGLLASILEVSFMTGVVWLFIDTLFFDTLIFVSFSNKFYFCKLKLI